MLQHVEVEHFTPRDQLDALTSTLPATVAERDELLSRPAVAARLKFLRQHVGGLVDAGELVGRQMPNSRYSKARIRR